MKKSCLLVYTGQLQNMLLQSLLKDAALGITGKLTLRSWNMKGQGAEGAG